MITVKVDGQVLPLELSGIRTMGELVELIKMNIDPDSVISARTIGGRDLVESDWRAPLSVHGGARLEIATATKQQFLRLKMLVILNAAKICRAYTQQVFWQVI